MTDLPPPPVPESCDLRAFQYLPLDVVRLRDSELTAAASGDEFRAAVLLWCASWHQIPASSLPKDDRALAHLAGYGRDLKGWSKVRDGAMRGWQEANDGRLYHRVVSEKAAEAWKARQEQRARTDAARAAREAKRKQGSDQTTDHAVHVASDYVSSSVTETVTETVTDNETGSKGREREGKGREGKGREAAAAARACEREPPGAAAEAAAAAAQDSKEPEAERNRKANAFAASRGWRTDLPGPGEWAACFAGLTADQIREIESEAPAPISLPSHFRAARAAWQVGKDQADSDSERARKAAEQARRKAESDRADAAKAEALAKANQAAIDQAREAMEAWDQDAVSHRTSDQINAAAELRQAIEARKPALVLGILIKRINANPTTTREATP